MGRFSDSLYQIKFYFFVLFLILFMSCSILAECERWKCNASWCKNILAVIEH